MIENKIVYSSTQARIYKANIISAALLRCVRAAIHERDREKLPGCINPLLTALHRGDIIGELDKKCSERANDEWALACTHSFFYYYYYL